MVSMLEDGKNPSMTLTDPNERYSPAISKELRNNSDTVEVSDVVATNCQ
jgi:hypothetical protein